MRPRAGLRSGAPRRRCSFPDTETREDAAQEILAGELAGDLIQRLLRAAQLLRHQLTGAPLGELPGGLLERGAGAQQRLEMAGARADRPTLDGLVADAALQVRAQLLDPGAGERGDVQARRSWLMGKIAGGDFSDISFVAGRQRRDFGALRLGEIALVENERHRHLLGEARALLTPGGPGRIRGGVDHEQHALGARDLGACAPHALLLDRIAPQAQAGCIEHVQRHAVDRNPLAHHVAGGAGNRGHDGRLVARQAIQQARLAGIGAAGEHHRHTRSTTMRRTPRTCSTSGYPGACL